MHVQLYSSFFRQVVTLARQHGSPSAPAADLRPLGGPLRVEHGFPPGRGTDPQAGSPGRRSSSVVSSSLASPCGRASKRGHSLVLGPGHRHDPRRDRQHYHLGVPGLHHLRFGRSGWQQPQECGVESQIHEHVRPGGPVRKNIMQGCARSDVSCLGGAMMAGHARCVQHAFDACMGRQNCSRTLGCAGHMHLRDWP